MAILVAAPETNSWEWDDFRSLLTHLWRLFLFECQLIAPRELTITNMTAVELLLLSLTSSATPLAYPHFQFGVIFVDFTESVRN